MKTQNLKNNARDEAWKRSAQDAATAAVEMGVLVADAIGIRKSEPSEYLQYLWARARAGQANHREIEEAFFTIPGSDSIWAVTSGQAAGSRVMVVGSGSFPSSLPKGAGRPFVTLWLGTTEPPVFTDGDAFVLLAHSVQELVDLSLIATAMAETLLIPGIVYLQITDLKPDLQPVQWPTAAWTAQFLGSPQDVIETPVAEQKDIWGDRRPRIPVTVPENVHVPAEETVWSVFEEIANRFAEATGRTYPLVRASAQNNGNIFSVTEIPNENNAILPTVLHPFPWRNLAEVVKGTPWVGVVSTASQTIAWQRVLQTAFDRAFARGTTGPVFTKVADRPVVVGVELSPEGMAWEELIAHIQKNYRKISLFKAKTPEHQSAENGEKARVQLRFVSENSLPVVRQIAQMLHQMTGWQFRVVGEHHGEAFHVLLHPSKLPHLKAESDVLITPDIDTALAENVLHLRENGALILPGHPEAAELVWQTLPDGVRKTILERKFSVYLINLDVVTGDRWEENTITAVMLGSIMKVLHEQAGSAFPAGALPEALPKSNNCHIDFAELYHQAFEGTRAVDAELISRYTPPVLEETEAGFSLPTPDQPRTLDAERYRDYLAFHLTGRYLYCPKWPYRTTGFIHPLIKAFQNPEQFRYDFPVCLLNDPEHPARPLREIVDEVIAQVQLDGEQKAQFEHDVLLAEKEIKLLVARGYEKPLNELWEMAVSGILHDVGAEHEKARSMNDNFNRALQMFPETVQVLGAVPEFPVKLFQHVWKVHWEAHSAPYREEVNRLLIGLTEILRLDESKSSVAHEPDRLKATVGDAYREELDFEALSDIIETTHIEGEPLPPERRKRVEEALQLLNGFYRLFDPQSADTEWDAALPNPWKVNHSEAVAAAIGEYQAQLHHLLRFFRAVHIARLEVENAYQPEKHDVLFQQFGFENLSAEELGMIPPLLLVADSARLTESDREVLNEALLSDLPLRVLLLSRNLCTPSFSEEDVPCSENWVLRAAFRALAQDHPFVLQSTAANVTLLSNGFREGLQANRPALFNVFAGDNATMPHLPSYLVWAAGTEARIFPSFKYNPEAGDTWAERFSLDGNPQPESDWSASEIRVTNEEEGALTISFTVADYLVHDVRFANHFQLLPADLQDERLVPLTDYLQLPETERKGKLPVIYLADNQGTLHRVLVTLAMARAAEQTAKHWRILQEWGGINNSLVARALETARQEMEAQKAKEIEALTAQFQAEMEKTVGQVAEEIVSNIAAGLLGQATLQPAAPAAGAVTSPPPAVETPPAETPAEETAEAPAQEEEEEEEALSFDEPYIETPRCTSCGECIAINSQIFAYNDNKQAYIKDATAGPYRDLVTAAEKCPVHIIHPGKPKDPNEPHLDELMERAKPYL